MRITDAIVELVKLWEQHGGKNVELVTSHGEITFRFMAFTEQEKKEDGVEDCIVICDAKGTPV